MTAPGACAADARNSVSRDGLLRAQNRVLRDFPLPDHLRTDAPQEPRARTDTEPPGNAADDLAGARSGGRVAVTTEQKSS